MLTISIIDPANMGAVAATRDGDWSSFVEGLRTPLDASTSKAALPLWSAASFKDGARNAAAVESVYVLTLDVDEAPIPTRAALEGALSGRRACVHSSSSATALAPRWRVVFDLSRPVSADEYRRLWPLVTGALPFPVGEASKDPSRAWYFPRRGEDGHFECFTTDGAPIDVDALLASAPAPTEATPIAPTPRSAPTSARRSGAAALLGAAWPATGRHEAQLALAGALRRDGWAREDALEMLCDVCRAAGDEDRPKRECTIAHTYEASGPITGWSSLDRHVDPAIVGAARDLLHPLASEWQQVERELFGEGASKGEARLSAAPPPDNPSGSFSFVSAVDLAKPVAPVDYVWRHFGVAPGRPTLLAGYGGVGKTFVVQSLALHIASGRGECWGMPVVQGPVRHFDYEMTLGPTQRRYQRIAAGHGIELATCRLGLASMPAVYLSSPNAEDALKRATEGTKVAIVDNLAAAVAGAGEKENESGIRRYLDILTRVTNATGCTFVVLVHERKASRDEGGGLQRVRGSSAITDAAGGVISVSAAEGDGVIVLSQSKASTRKKGDDLTLQIVDVWDTPIAPGGPGGDDDAPGLRVDRLAEAPLNEQSEKLQAKILGLLAKGPQETVDKVTAALRARKDGSVGRELRALEVRKEIRKIAGKGYCLDSPGARRDRIVEAVGQTRNWRSHADVARGACVDSADVAAAVRDGFIATSAEGGYIVINGPRLASPPPPL